MKPKEKHRQNILEYLANPDNEWMNRETLASDVCGISKQTLYSHFTPQELQEIEAESLEIRRKQYSVKLSQVDQAVLDAALKGDIQAAKLAYQRFEGWSEKAKLEHSGGIETVTRIVRNYVDKKR